MSKELQLAQVPFTPEQVEVLKTQIAPTATDDELLLFMWQCKRSGLDPFGRQIYFMKNNGKAQTLTSIDGFRLIAERSGKYEGQAAAQWCGKDGVWKDIWSDAGFPYAARVGVFKKGFREALYAVAHWGEYYTQPGFMHKKMPALMIAKVAESLALRKAFPNEMSGLYTEEEMGKEPDPVADHDQKMAAEGIVTRGMEYTIPFGSFKGWTPDRALENFGPEKLGRSVELCEEKLATGKAYSNTNFSEMKEYIAVISKLLADYERGDVEQEGEPHEDPDRPHPADYDSAKAYRLAIEKHETKKEGVDPGDYGKFKSPIIQPRKD